MMYCVYISVHVQRIETICLLRFMNVFIIIIIIIMNR